MTIPKLHQLKTWLEYYPDIDNHTKNFELRKNDRNFQVHDFVKLYPVDRRENKIGNRFIIAKITYLLSDSEKFGLENGHVILALKFWKDFTREEIMIYRLIEAGKICPGSDVCAAVTA
jgi:hypothetical protein